METFFPTSTPAMQEEIASYNEAWASINNLKQSLATAENMRGHWERKAQGLSTQIANVKGYIFDMLSMNGSIDEDIKAIAELLDITLTKTISGSATLEISWTAEVPIDFDSEDFEIGFDVECDTYEAENFEWDVVRQDIICEDENYG